VIIFQSAVFLWPVDAKDFVDFIGKRQQICVIRLMVGMQIARRWFFKRCMGFKGL
jgi:hypothetical protein